MALRDLAYPGTANYPYTDVDPMDAYLAEGRADLKGLSPREVEGRFGAPGFRSNEVNPLAAIISDKMASVGTPGLNPARWSTELTQDALNTYATGDKLPWQKVALAGLEMPIGTAGKAAASLPVMAGYGIVPKMKRLSKKEKGQLEYAQSYMKGATAENERVLAMNAYAETQAYQGLQGEWRLWVNDHDAVVRPFYLDPDQIKMEKDYKIGRMLDHPELFKKVPETKKVKVVFTKFLGDATAEFYVPVDALGNFIGTPKIKLNAKLLQIGKDGKFDSDRLRSLVVHELSHFEDARAGMSAGGSTGLIEELITKEYPTVTRNLKQAKQRAELAGSQLKTMAGKASYEEMAEAKKYLKQVIEEHDELKKRYLKLDDLVKNRHRDGSEFYFGYRHQLGGEVKAFDAQSRLELLTAKEAKEEIPGAALHGALGPKQNENQLIHLTEADKQFGDYTSVANTARYGMKKGRASPLYHGTPNDEDLDYILEEGFTKGRSSELQLPGTSVSRDPLVSSELFADSRPENVLKVDLDIDPSEIANLKPSEYMRGEVPAGKVYGKPQTEYHESELYGLRTKEQVPLTQKQIDKLTQNRAKLHTALHKIRPEIDKLNNELKAARAKNLKERGQYAAPSGESREVSYRLTRMRSWKGLIESRLGDISKKLHKQKRTVKEELPPFTSKRLSNKEDKRLRKQRQHHRQALSNIQTLNSILKGRRFDPNFSETATREVELNIMLSKEEIKKTNIKAELEYKDSIGFFPQTSQLHYNKVEELPNKAIKAIKQQRQVQRYESRQYLRSIFQEIESIKGNSAFYERAIARAQGTGGDALMKLMSTSDLATYLYRTLGYTLDEIRPVFKAFRKMKLASNKQKRLQYTVKEDVSRAAEYDQAYREYKRSRDLAMKEANKLFGVH